MSPQSALHTCTAGDNLEQGNWGKTIWVIKYVGFEKWKFSYSFSPLIQSSQMWPSGPPVSVVVQFSNAKQRDCAGSQDHQLHPSSLPQNAWQPSASSCWLKSIENSWGEKNLHFVMLNESAENMKNIHYHLTLSVNIAETSFWDVHLASIPFLRLDLKEAVLIHQISQAKVLVSEYLSLTKLPDNLHSLP